MEKHTKTVLLGVSGCIGAYKACEIVRALQKDGYDVCVVMTENASKFVGVPTFEALTHSRVFTEFFCDGADPILHITLAEKADLFLIAPCTANVLAKIACGIADDLLTTTVLAATCPVVIAPAMNVHMYENPITQENIERLRKRGVLIVEPDEGYLACGDTGRGRLPQPETIVSVVKDVLDQGSVLKKKDLAGKKVLITAGPTIEPIDPIRYITNRSSGKMGYAIAKSALDRGAQVVLISGPVTLDPPAKAEVISVDTAEEMLECSKKIFPECDIAICSAAVGDFRMERVYDEKIKKDDDRQGKIEISLVENPDILKTLAASKRKDQIVVGFAAETNDVIENAKKKLVSKGADILVANEVGFDETFGKDDIVASFVSNAGIISLPKMTKAQLANKIFDHILKS